MLQKYDLEQMLREVREDEAEADGSAPKDKKLSQEDIKRKLAEKRNGASR